MTIFCEFFWGSLWMPIALNGLFLKKVGIKKRIQCMLAFFLIMLFSSLFNVGEITVAFDFVLFSFTFLNIMRCTWVQLVYIPLSYILIVLCNYIVDFSCLTIWHLTDEQIRLKMPYVFYIDLSITVLVFLFSFLLGKMIKYSSFFGETKVKKEMIWLIGGNIILCTIVFLINGWAARKSDFPDGVTQTNLILFGAYTVLTIAISLIVLKVFREREEMEHEKQQYESLQEYTKQIETMYTNLRTFKHDYVNILTSLSGYLDTKDYEGLEKYFTENILPTNQIINRENYRLNQLSNIKEQGLKGLISSKLIYAHEMGIDVYIDVMEPIEKIAMKAIDFSRIMGIYLDNAIEAAMECEKKEIKFNMVKEEHTVAIILMNSFQNKDIPFSLMEQCGYSSKGEDRGLGLHNVKEILKKYENVCKTTSVEGKYFMQMLEISNLE